jgi:hypothetical protein
MKKLTTWSLIFLLFISLIPAFNPATKASLSTWYISLTGNDNNAGDISHPFKTLQKAINASTTGNTIYIRRGDYTAPGFGALNYIKINRSHITIRNYPGEKVVIDGKLKTLVGSYGMIQLFTYGVSYWHNITFYGINFSNCSHVGVFANCLTGIGSNDDITFSHCDFYNITENVIYIYDETESPTTNCKRWNINNCTFTRIQNNASMGECITLMGAQDFIFENNTLREFTKQGLSLSAGTNNGIIQYNTFNNKYYFSLKMSGESATNRTVHDITIRNNLFTGTAKGTGATERAISINPEQNNNYIYNIYIYNNVFNLSVTSGQTCYGLHILGATGKTGQRMRNIQFTYNTIYVNGGTSTTKAIYAYLGPAKVNDFVIANNILVMEQSGNQMIFADLAKAQTNFTLRNNLYMYTSGTTLGSWFTDDSSEFETGAVSGDPDFADNSTGNLHINITSPAIDAADANYAVSTDYDDHPRPQKKSYDIGAYEYNTALPPAITNILIIPNPQQKGKYLNISCHITDNAGGVKEVRVHITYPDHTTQNLSMKPRYYLNQTYSQKGTYQFFIWADDTSGNSVKSATYQFSITPNGAQVIIDNSMNTAGTGDRFVVTTTITYSDSVAAAYLEYWFDSKTKTNVSMSNTAGDTWEYHSIQIPIRSTDDLYYNISAKNVNNTWSSLTNQQVTVIDDDSPVISNVLATPDSIAQGKYVNITCDVNDNIEVDTVKVDISGPIGFTPVHTTLNTGNYYYNTTYTIEGTYEYFVWANDTNRNSDLSIRHTFQVISLLRSTFLVGMISDENNSNESTINFKAKFVFSIEFNPFSFNILSSNEKILISKQYFGYIGTKFIFGVFNGVVLSE